MKHLRLYESTGDDVLLNQIKADMQGIRMDGDRPVDEPEIYEKGRSVSCSFRHLGRWVHDEANHDSEDGEDWMEDDDNEVWAPGEAKKYMEKFQAWAKGKTWFDKVKLSFEGSEKNYMDFVITLK